ncbi:MAG: sulfotransferase domain-containing protein [Oceanicaulis sp.]
MQRAIIPDFVIPGAMKSGTTTLADYLGMHPQISFARQKEPNMIMRHDYDRLMPGFQPPNPLRIDDEYKKCFDVAQSGQLTGEASTAYFADEKSPFLLKERNSKLKCIFILRDPIDRAYSAFNYLRSTFIESENKFYNALNSEILGERDNIWPTWRFINYSKYQIHLRRWAQAFPREQMLLLEFEEFKFQPLDFVNKVYQFLELPMENNLPDSKEIKNVTVNIDRGWKRMIMQGLYRPSVFKSSLKYLIPEKMRFHLRHAINDTIATQNAPFPPMSEAELALLRSELSEVQAALAEEFEFRPKHWNLL